MARAEDAGAPFCRTSRLGTFAAWLSSVQAPDPCRAADATLVSWAEFDGIYLFNPLAENLFAREVRIDDHVELSAGRFRRDATRVEDALRAARIGTSLVTYHGSSTRIPVCYELEAS